MQTFGVNARFFGEFAPGRGSDVLFCVPKKAAWQGSSAPVRIDPAIDKQHMQTPLPQGQNHQINREQHIWGLPGVVLCHDPTLNYCQSDSNYLEGHLLVTRSMIGQVPGQGDP
jgi:hypothetical protein